MDLAVIKGTMPKRRVSKKELNAPDEVQTRLSKVVNFLLAHRHWVAAGLISVILIGSGTYLWQRQRMKREEASSWMLSQALREEGEKRIATLGELIERYPGTSSAVLAHLFRARAQMEGGRWQEAEKDLRYLLGRAPEPLRAEARCMMADVLREKGEEEEAMAFLQKCQEEGRGWIDPYALFKEALLNDLRGRKEEALKAYERVLPLLPPGELNLFVRLRVKELSGS